MGLISMNTKELTRLRVIQDLISCRTTSRAASQLLGITVRQVSNLRQRFMQCGPAGIASLRRGKPSNRKLPDSIKEHSINIVRTHYADFGPTFASQKLREQHGISVCVETLRTWMKADGLWIERKEKRKAVYQPRYRRDCLGELIQIDGSQHWWFEDRGPRCTLLVYIDDATSRLMHLKFAESESAFSYFTATTEYLHMHGKPVAFYSDKHSIFRISNKNAVGGDGMTQFGRSLHELNIDIICANTPQAKGRVERANRTLQDRLVKELRLAGVCNMDEANALLPIFMADYNSRFSKLPLNTKDLHRSLGSNEMLEDIFVWREERTVSACLTLQYDKVIFMLEPNDVTRGLARKRVTVSDYPGKRIMISYNGLPLAYTIFDKVRQVDQAAIVDNKRLSAALELIQEQQALRPLSRSEKAPRRTNQHDSIFNAGAPISQKKRARRLAVPAMARPPSRLRPQPVSHAARAELSYEDELCIAIGRKVRAEQELAGEKRRDARQHSRTAHLRMGQLSEGGKQHVDTLALAKAA